MEQIKKILEFIKAVIDLPTSFLAFLTILLTLVLIFEEKIFAPGDITNQNTPPIYMELDTISGELNETDLDEEVIEISVLKDNIPVRIIGYYISLAEKDYVFLKIPTTKLTTTIRNEPLIAINVLLYDENRWLLDRYDSARGIILPNFELMVNNSIVPKSTIKYYTASDGKQCVDYVCRLSDIK